MKINGHAHIFNLQTVLTDEAIRVMVNRIRDRGVPGYVVDAVESLLQEQLDRPEYLSEDELLAKLVELMVRKGKASAVADLPLQLHQLGSGTGGVGVMALRAAMDSISAAMGGGEGPGTSGWDIYYTLRVALQPDITKVAGKLLAHLGPDDAIVALMMDITSPEEPERDRRNFRKQMLQTQDAVVAYPGRVLPFFAVNPRRADHFDLMKNAVLEQGFLGVKLYPSLGYELATDEIRAVLDFCREHDAPITIHTSAGGFKRDDAAAEYCHPGHWAELLEPDDGLRVCFAHCGGWGGLCGQVQDQLEWAERIFEFMDGYAGIYADISYHVDQMHSLEAQEAYFEALEGLIDGGGRGDRIIFGTDSWLLRLSMDDRLYWDYFEGHLGEARFRKIARDAPARFLGLPLDGAEARPNVKRHLEWLEARAEKVGSAPAKWVREGTVGVPWKVVPRDTGWSERNDAHVLIYDQFRDQVPGATFESLGATKLGDCEYFQRHAGGPSELLLKVRILKIMNACHGVAEPEAAHDRKTITRTLRSVLRDPNKTVGDVGRTVDSLYLFPAEEVA